MTEQAPILTTKRVTVTSETAAPDAFFFRHHSPDALWKRLAQELLGRMDANHFIFFHRLERQPQNLFDRSKRAQSVLRLANPVLNSLEKSLHREPKAQRRMSIGQFGDLCNLAARNKDFAESVSFFLLTSFYQPKMDVCAAADFAPILVDLFFSQTGLSPNTMAKAEKPLSFEAACAQAERLLPKTRRNSATNVLLKKIVRAHCPRNGA